MVLQAAYSRSDEEQLFLRFGQNVFDYRERKQGIKMSQGKWLNKWKVQSESDSTKFYTVSQAENNSFGCSCPQWIFRKQICKHIQGVAQTIVGLEPTDTAIVDRLRFVSKMHHIKLSCANCEHNDDRNWIISWNNRRSTYCKKGHSIGNKTDLMFVKDDKKTFYILGRCCKYYEKRKDK